jgi:type 1 glutamine amidotransferase
MKRKAMIVQGHRWHDPEDVSDAFTRMLVEENFEVEISETLDAYADVEKLKSLDLIIPLWTMGDITDEQIEPIFEAVSSGVGLAGCHAGLCDAFRKRLKWQYMTGGIWLDHPGSIITYTVNIKHGPTLITEGLKDFEITSEQYYLLVDPAVVVLASTQCMPQGGYNATNGVVEMPVVWTKRWGKGRIFYNSIGHDGEPFNKIEQVYKITQRGFSWAAEGKKYANL